MNSFVNNYEKNELNESISDCESSDGTLNESVDQLSDSYLSLSLINGRIGATLYESSSHCLKIMNELQENNDFQSVKALLLQTEPNHVIISSKSDLNLIQLLNSFAINSSNDSIDNNNDNYNKDNYLMDKNVNSSETKLGSISGSDNVKTTTTPLTPQTSIDPKNILTSSESDSSDSLWHFDSRFQLHLVSHKYFNYENSKTRLLSLNFPNININDNISHNINDSISCETQKFIHISSTVDLSQNNTIRSMGALLKFMDENRIGFESQTNSSVTQISDICLFYLQELISIDRNTYESLQIFQNEWHPSAYKQGIHMKEGLSLYGLFNCCVSKIGANYMRRLFLRPTQEIDIITDRLNVIEFFIQTNNHVLRDNLKEHLKHISNVSPLLNRLKDSNFTVNDLKTLHKTLINALLVRDITVRQSYSLKVFNKIRNQFTKDLDHLLEIINKVVDFEESAKTQRFEVNFGIDHELDSAKSTFNRLPELLNEIAEQELLTFRDVFQECNCVYIPQIGFLTSAPFDGKQSENSYQELGLEFAFSAGDRAYYKSFRMRELDEHFGDIQSEIYDRHIQILNRLQNFIVSKKYVFDSIMKLCAKLDCLIAMSQTAINYNYSRPNLTSNGVIEIIDGRHPLLELMPQSFVPNNTQSGGQYKKVKILSGPNACGKSVYLKQICLIIYMAHIGSFVPALRADITIIDRMFTRIYNPESISSRLSTFMSDLNQISNATKYATKRSLVVIDEFGKGTQPVDGIALMASSLKHWILNDTPHLFISTHFHSLTSFFDNNQSFECLTFQFMRDETQIIHLYKLVTGVVAESIASHIALLAAIPLHVIERGIQICEFISTKQPINRFHFEQLENKFSKYTEIATKLLEINTDSDEEVQQFLKFLFQSK